MWLLFVAAGIVAAVASAAGKPVRVASEPVRVGADEGEAVGIRIVDVHDKWWCGPGRKIPIPQPSDVLPSEVIAMGGPIVQTIEVMIGAVKEIFAKLGWGKKCTVRGGELVIVALAERRSSPRTFTVGIQVGYPDDDAPPEGYGSHPVGASWEWQGATGDSVELPRVMEEHGTPPMEAAHFVDGREPPAGHVWPHGNLLKWQAYGGAEYVRRPRVYVLRSGDTLSLAVWLPPRAPLQHVNKWGTAEVFDAPVRWRIAWKVSE